MDREADRGIFCREKRLLHMIADFLSPPMLEEATDWLLRLQEEPANAALRKAHRDWLAVDAAHQEAWAAVQHTWALTGHMKTEEFGAEIVPFVQPSSARRHVRRSATAFMAMAALAACFGLALLMPGILLHLDADAVTARAENRAMTLADGSVVTLGGASALSADVAGPAGRRARLLRGEAHFQIAPDRQRPFIIAAGDVNVTVVGTAFDVTMGPQSVSVAVASGLVEVAKKDRPGALTRLQPGERIEIDRQTGAAVLVRMAPEDVGAWRDRRLVVHDLPLSEAMERLGRYYRGEILSLAGGLEQQRISGVFDLDDPARALRGMLGAAGPALRGTAVQQITPYLIVLEK
jgi:transmembrane sensor